MKAVYTLVLCAIALAVCVEGARQGSAASFAPTADQRSPPRYNHEHGGHNAGPTHHHQYGAHHLHHLHHQHSQRPYSRKLMSTLGLSAVNKAESTNTAQIWPPRPPPNGCYQLRGGAPCYPGVAVPAYGGPAYGGPGFVQPVPLGGHH